MLQIIITSLVLLLSLALLLGSAIFLFYHLRAAVSGAPFASSNRRRVKTMVKLANVKDGQKIVDLGSGDGRILIAAAERYDIEGVGYEINPLWYFVSLFKVKQSRIKGKIKIYRRSYWPADLGNFDVIFLFLIPYNMKRMQKKLQRELKPGTVVVSNSFKFNNWQPVKEEDSVFLYKMGYNLRT